MTHTIELIIPEHTLNAIPLDYGISCAYFDVFKPGRLVVEFEPLKETPDDD